ncbi:speckle-type POZ protein B-like isoform X2 [Cotesia typhae]
MKINACKLLSRKDEFLPDDILTICVDLTVYDDPMTIANPIHSLKGSGRKLTDDFRDLLATKTKSDIVIIVGNKKFDAHKIVLIARSNFFKAMFSHDMKESKENKVTIPDIDPKIFEKLLEFIYTDQIGDLDDFAEELLEASDKYQLQGLKETCEISLAKTLNTENAIKVLILADRYNATQLKEIVRRHININFTEIKNTEDYKALGKYQPSLFASTLHQKFDDGIDIK